MRYNNRKYDELRKITITRNYIKYPEGSVLIEFGETKVICNATVEETLPHFLKDKHQGWLSAEYSMLPRATHTRTKRESVAGKVSPRSTEISRLIGRSLRAGIDLSLLGERQILIDCDVIQADGGTRTAAITGGFIALSDAIAKLISQGKISQTPLKHKVAAVSVGVLNNNCLLDLDYSEDSNSDSDINIVMLDDLSIVEIQGTAEKNSFSTARLNSLIDLAQKGISEIFMIK